MKQNISSQSIIKQKISEYINAKSGMFKDETNIESLKENIYCNYLIFENLNKNKIKHALIYIGDITNVNYEEIFENIFMEKKDVITSKNTKKLDIIKIKGSYIKLKALIKEFDKNLSNITRLKEKDLRPIFEELEKSIKDLYTSQKCILFKNIYNNIKFDAFIFYQDSIKSIYKDINNSPAMNKLNNHFNLKFDILSEKDMFKLIDKARDCPEKYGKKIIFLVNEINYYLREIRSKSSYFPQIISNIFYKIVELNKSVDKKIKKANRTDRNVIEVQNNVKDKDKSKKNSNEPNKKESKIYKIGFEFPPNFFNNLPFKECINKLFDKDHKKTKKLFIKDCILSRKNLCEKIIFDLNKLFKPKNSNYSFIEILKKTEFDLLEDKRKVMLSFYSKALDLFGEINETIEIEKKKEIINNLTSKLYSLNDNILSFNIYSVIFNKIEEIIVKQTIEYFMNEMNQFKTNPNEIAKK